jgi:hypothetical protein
MALLAMIPSQLLLQIVSIRLKRDYAASPSHASAEVMGPVVMLIKHRMLGLSTLYNSLQPADEEAVTLADAQKEFLARYKFSGASLVSGAGVAPSAADLLGDEEDGASARSSSQHRPSEEAAPAASAPQAASANAPASSSASFPYEAETLKAFAKNQKFDLCRRLLQDGQWGDAAPLLKRLQSQGLALCVELQHELCVFIDRMIEPLYRTPAVCGPIVAASRKVPSVLPLHCQVRSFADITTVLFPALQLAGPAIGTHPVLHAKV